MSETKKCPYCAEEIKKETIFCRYCEHDLPSETRSLVAGRESNMEGDIAQQRKSSKKKRSILWIIILIALCSGGYAVFKDIEKKAEIARLKQEEAARREQEEAAQRKREEIARSEREKAIQRKREEIARAAMKKYEGVYFRPNRGAARHFIFIENGDVRWTLYEYQGEYKSKRNYKLISMSEKAENVTVGEDGSITIQLAAHPYYSNHSWAWKSGGTLYIKGHVGRRQGGMNYCYFSSYTHEGESYGTFEPYTDGLKAGHPAYMAGKIFTD